MKHEASGGRPLHVAVLMGGTSMEREISLQSGHAVAQALRERAARQRSGRVQRGFHVAARDGRGLSRIARDIRRRRTIQQLLEQRGVPYTGSGPEASALAFDKVAAKKAFLTAGLQTAQHAVLERGGHDGAELEQLGFPVVVKPCGRDQASGSTWRKTRMNWSGHAARHGSLTTSCWSSSSSPDVSLQ